ncbi:rhodanese-like domain-containing protein [Deinococcus radiopugnans]|uniref:Rhodanese-like domain-containing protein n=1 Tax=Deinococcus radiopugnans ATCC 19172 TaxID=585398 RepID=A0A5C4YBF5_9DEIO|nr:rhodanese-like domain-containing protein [Deinococcus radiopugnans]MBB6015363.1 rhodanese-related sulfurtransferase [Deinococcus radiopugnans ATCC 19172]TNM72946.1 rhodanese-like domain-containing protein [Deinococcus radiopugnans ATCC 19172]
MSYQDIFTAEVATRVREGAYLYDVRETDEYVQGHIPGAISLPLSQLAGRENEIQTPAIIVCLSGGRSAQAARHLAAQGKQDVMNLNGGTMGWISEGREVTQGPHP